MRVRVIGVGSPWGDDAAGPRVARRLAASGLPPGASAVPCERPFPDLLDQLADVDHVILVDAVRSGRPAGALCWLSRAEVARCAATSSHGLGTARVLDLAEALQRHPLPVEILGIEMGSSAAGEPCAAVERSIVRACTLVQCRLEQLLAAAAGAGT